MHSKNQLLLICLRTKYRILILYLSTVVLISENKYTGIIKKFKFKVYLKLFR